MDCFEDLLLSDISADNRTFCISRSGPAQKLVESVRRSGIADPPVVLKKDGTLIPVTGHNRLKAASGVWSSVRCRIVEKYSSEDFLRHAAAKLYRGELGPVGKLRAFSLLCSDLFDQPLAGGTDALAQLEISPEAGSLAAEILRLDPVLLAFCDDKMVPLKTLLMLNAVPPAVRDCLSLWVSRLPVRMSCFRSAIDLISDLSRVMDSGQLLSAAGDALAASDSDEHAVAVLNRKRNPVSSEIAEKERKIAASFKRQGIEIVFPPHMEGNSVEFRVKMMRKDRGVLFRKSVSVLAGADLEEILSLL